MPTEVPEIPNVPEQITDDAQIDLPDIINPYLLLAWTTQTITQVPENVMGWLVAQGYEVTGITQDTTTVPPTNYFALSKEGMTPRQAVLSLCNSYTIAANEARDANEERYNYVVREWTQMIGTSHDQFEAQTTQQNAQAGIFFTDLDNYMTAIETLIADNQTQLGLDASEAKTVLLAMDLRLSELEENAADSAVVINNLLVEQESNLQTYIADYDDRLDELQQNLTAHVATVLDEVGDLETVLESHVADYTQQLDSLVANYNFHVADVDALLSNLSSNVNTYVSDVAAILTALDSDYQSVSTDLGAIRTSSGSLVSAHVSDYATVLAALSSDHAAHATLTRSITDFLDSDFQGHSIVATGFLDGLGSTETARINEEAAAKLSAQMQLLVSKGLYMSTIPVDVVQRNWRDRDEQIQLHNDRLMREKLENEHKLYEQQRAVRAQTLDNEHRLYQQKIGMRSQTLDGKNQLHSVQQEVLRYQASLISGVYALLQETRNRTLAGKQAIFAAKDANERLGIEVQSRLYGQLQDVRQRILDASDRIYQLRDLYAKWANSETHKTYEQLQQVKQQFIEAVERQLEAKQGVVRSEMSQRDILLQQLQTALLGLLGGKEKFSAMLMQNAKTLSEHKHRAIAERLDTAVKRLAGWQSIADENRKLMMYQIDERNKLLIGLYSFVERRTDIGPEWKDQAAMIASLGDAAGGWIQP